MDPGWIEALNRLWTHDEPIEFAAVEREWQLRALETGGASNMKAASSLPTRHRLMICLTGFNDLQERTALQERITSNGGVYTPDLTKTCSYLVVAKPEGKKYAAARNWKIKTVSVEWLIQSTDRGMILNEKYFDPTMPPEERGKGAQVTVDVSFSKRPRPVDSFAESEGRHRKLRKTASVKLSCQRNSFLGDLLTQKPTAQVAAEKDDWEDIAAPVPNPENEYDASPDPSAVNKTRPLAADAGIFSTSYFFVYGFGESKEDIVRNAIKTHGGRVCRDEDEVKHARAPQFPWHRFIVVPQESKPDALDFEDDGISPVQVVTEFFIEKCMVHNRLHDPKHHVLGRPFPSFPIPGFEKLVVCSAGFAGIDLHHFARVISQLGGKFEETFRANTSILVCKSLASIRDVKKKFAIDHNIPIVKEKWLWEGVSTGKLAPVEPFMFAELGQNITERRPLQRTRSEPGLLSKVKKANPPLSLAVDSGSGETSSSERRSRATKSSSGSSSRYKTAPTNIGETDTTPTVRPLEVASANVVNRSESPVSNPPRESPDDKPDSEKSDAPEDIIRQLDEDKRQAEEKRTREEEQRKAQPAERRRKAAIDEEQKGRTQAEEEQRRKAEELLGFQSRVASLIERRSGDATADSQESIEHITATISLPAKKERRKRGIFGRAVSSVSVTSNHSNSEYRERGLELDGSSLVDDSVIAHHEENPLLAMTQVEYRDPEATAARDGILRRMNEGRGRV
jgi:DNA replication regulator DPB11